MSCDFVVLKFYLPNFRAYLYPDIQNLNWKSVDFITKQQDKSSVKTFNQSQLNHSKLKVVQTQTFDHFLVHLTALRGTWDEKVWVLLIYMSLALYLVQEFSFIPGI